MLWGSPQRVLLKGLQGPAQGGISSPALTQGGSPKHPGETGTHRWASGVCGHARGRRNPGYMESR